MSRRSFLILAGVIGAQAAAGLPAGLPTAPSRRAFRARVTCQLDFCADGRGFGRTDDA